MNHAALTPESSPNSPRRIGRWITILVLLAIGAALTWRGWEFYKLDLADRAAHPDYRRLNPSGFLGHGYGIVGTAFIFTNLLYLVRRRFAKHWPAWGGSMRTWLNMHAFTGLFGSLLVVFHSAFQLRTAIASLTSISLLIVVVTGLVGFYLYALVPTPGAKVLRQRLAEIRVVLPGFAAEVETAVAAVPVTRIAHDASLFRTLVTVPRWMLEARARRAVLRKAARADKIFRVLTRTEPALARAFLDELNGLVAKEVDTQVAASMMRSWRSLHRFLAILMVVSVSVHIGVAWFYGFRWIFDQ
jgi:hypothetical protein